MNPSELSSHSILKSMQSLKRSDHYRFLGLSDLPFEKIEAELQKNLAPLVGAGSEKNSLSNFPVEFLEDPFFQYAVYQGQVFQYKVGKNREQEIPSHFFKSSSEEFSCKAYVIEVLENESVHLVFHDEAFSKGVSFDRLYILARKHSNVELTWVQASGFKSQARILVHLSEPEANVQVHTLQLSKGDQSLDMWVEVKHLAPRTQSNVLSWSAGLEQSQTIFNGVVTIGNEAPFSDTNQRNKNLILSPRASVTSLPKLFIHQNEVKAAHGSSVSTFNPDQLMYLRARGLSALEAESMLLKGFVHLPLEWLKDQKLRGEIEARLLGTSLDAEWGAE